MHPYKFEPVYKQIIWGGDKIKRRFGRTVPFEKTAESWDVCCRPDGMSVVCEGQEAGKTLSELIAEYGERLLGTVCVKKYGGGFPLLIKLIDANDRLSVQVHPDDAYAHSQGEKNGKNELWYVIEAKPDARLVYGLKESISRQDFEKAIRDGNTGKTLREVPVKAGSFLYIPAGTVHAIFDGILIAEIQQNSNTTYRIFDWDRVEADGRPRELHINNALEVINFGVQPEMYGAKPISCGISGCTIGKLIHGDYFCVNELRLEGRWQDMPDGKSFYIIINLDAPVRIVYSGGEMRLEAGETVLIPANLGTYYIEGKSTLLLIWIE